MTQNNPVGPTGKIAAIIIARGGSTRLPRKNLLAFHGRTLVAHKVYQLKQCRHLTQVIVGSEDPEILAEAGHSGADTIERASEFCDERSRSWNEVILDMVSRVNAEIILWAHCTNPCIRPVTYDRALEEFALGRNANYIDSLVGVTPIKTHLWFKASPLNFDPWAPVHAVAAGLEPAYAQHGGIFIARREDMLRWSYVYGRTPLLFPISNDEATDIDTAEDFERAVLLYRGV